MRDRTRWSLSGGGHRGSHIWCPSWREGDGSSWRGRRSERFRDGRIGRESGEWWVEVFVEEAVLVGDGDDKEMEAKFDFDEVGEIEIEEEGEGEVEGVKERIARSTTMNNTTAFCTRSEKEV